MWGQDRRHWRPGWTTGMVPGQALFAECVIFSSAWWILKKLRPKGRRELFYFRQALPVLLQPLPHLPPLPPSLNSRRRSVYTSGLHLWGVISCRQMKRKGKLLQLASRPLPFLSPNSPSPLPSSSSLLSLLFLLIKSLEIWNQHRTHILQLTARSQVSEETTLYPSLLTKAISPFSGVHHVPILKVSHIFLSPNDQLQFLKLI